MRAQSHAGRNNLRLPAKAMEGLTWARARPGGSQMAAWCPAKPRLKEFSLQPGAGPQTVAGGPRALLPPPPALLLTLVPASSVAKLDLATSWKPRDIPEVAKTHFCKNTKWVLDSLGYQDWGTHRRHSMLWGTSL